MHSLLLQLHQVGLRFGGRTVVNAVDLNLPKGKLHGLIGPNGAGKTSLINLITGVYAPSSGTVSFAGENLAGLRPDQITALGIARTFQNIRLFARLSAFDNVRVACNLHRASSPLRSLLRGRAFRIEEAAIAANIDELFTLFNLGSCRDKPATTLTIAEKRRLEIVRALATQPRLLLLDEPASGLNHAEKAELVHQIRELHRRFDLTILLVEHSVRVATMLCERITAMDCGVKIAEGTPLEIHKNTDVIEAYLGEDHTDNSDRD